jgi:hypothetical protein
MAAEDQFDLLAAGLRADSADVHVSVEVLASKLEDAFPGSARVERRGGGLLGRGDKRVRNVRVSIGQCVYVLEVDGQRMAGYREKQVGGISIKREQLDAGRWVASLVAELRDEAGRSAEAREALERLLR